MTPLTGHRPRGVLAACLTLAATALGACSGAGPGGVIQFTDHDIDIGLTQSGAIQVINRGAERVDGFRFGIIAVRDTTGLEVGGASLSLFRSTDVPLEPDRKLGFSFQIVASPLPPGSFELTLGIFIDETLSDRARIRWGKSLGAATLADRVRIRPPALEGIMAGDSVRFDVEAFARGGQPVQTSEAVWYVLPTDAGRIGRHGVFIPNRPGIVRIVVAIGNVKDELTVRIVP